MKSNLLKTFGVLLLIGALTAVFIPSCKKNTDCTAIIHVIDTAGKAVPNAIVILHKTNVTQYNGVTANVSDTKVSDVAGETSHTFQLPAVLDITVKTDTTKLPIRIGSGVVRLQEGETVEQTVRVY
ncbi:MAG: hypothetical protein WCL14_02225 [Bacteroidota bacterium]